MSLTTFEKISDIQISSSRQRSELDKGKVYALSQSIQDRGLLHAIVVAEQNLLAGQNRLEAMTMLHELGVLVNYGTQVIPVGCIPVVEMGNLDELEKLEIEWAENEFREPLTWQDRAKAESALHDLRVKQRAGRGEVQSYNDTIAELLESPVDELHPQEVARVRERLQVAKYLNDPMVAKAKTAAEAKSIIRRKESSEANLKAAQAFSLEASSGVENLTLINDSCLNFLSKYNGPKFDVIISDPPYGIDAHTFGDGVTSQNSDFHQYDDSYESWGKLMDNFLAALSTQVAEECSMFLFCDLDRFHELRRKVRESGWWVQRTPIIWDKGRSTRLPVPGKSFRRQYEVILLAVRGAGTTALTCPDVLTFPSDENLNHGAQKPVALYQYLAESVNAHNKYILDPFAGSCPILEVKGNYITAVELDKTYSGIGAGRLTRLKAQGSLV